MKTTSIFGGVQVFQIIIGIIRSKFIAVLLGPAGMGIAGLLSATTGMVEALTNFGLGTSVVKNIAEAHATDDQNKLGRVSSIFKRLVWFTGALGFFITLVFSPCLSQITFGNKDYTWAFMLLSITLLVNQISSGQSVLLRGTRNIKLMVKSSMLGSVIGLVTTIPLYYMYGMQGIVPALIIAAFTALTLTWYFSNQLSIQKVAVTWKETFAEGKEMLYMGFMISLSGIITLAMSYIVRLFISNSGTLEDVGLYNAGFAIINTYVGMIFTAMSTDFFPRLSAVAHETKEANKVINQQAEISVLILAPIILIFIVFIKWVIFVLYSEAFLPLKDMILYVALGMLFKAIGWAIGFLFLAKSASKAFLKNEMVWNVYNLALSILGYYYFGITGLGISFLISYFLYSVQVYYFSKSLFQFQMDRELMKIFAIQLTLAISCFLVVFFFKDIYTYVIGTCLIILSTLYSLKELNKRMNIKSLFNKK